MQLIYGVIYSVEDQSVDVAKHTLSLAILKDLREATAGVLR